MKQYYINSRLKAQGKSSFTFNFIPFTLFTQPACFGKAQHKKIGIEL